MKARKNRTACNATTTAGPGPTHEVVTRLAELFWEKEGRPAGRDIEFWLRAEAALRETNEPTHDELKP